MIWTCSEFGLSGWSINIIAAVLTVVLGILMVSNIRYRSFKDLDLKHNVRFLTILIIVFILILIAIDPPRILFAVFFLYAISGPVMTFWQLRKKRRQRRK